MFGRATIGLGIGPHSSWVKVLCTSYMTQKIGHFRDVPFLGSDLAILNMWEHLPPTNSHAIRRTFEVERSKCHQNRLSGFGAVRAEGSKFTLCH